MPRKGYSGVTLKNRVVNRLKKLAEEGHRTVPQLIEHMLDTQYPEPEVPA